MLPVNRVEVISTHVKSRPIGTKGRNAHSQVVWIYEVDESGEEKPHPKEMRINLPDEQQGIGYVKGWYFMHPSCHTVGPKFDAPALTFAIKLVPLANEVA